MTHASIDRAIVLAIHNLAGLSPVLLDAYRICNGTLDPTLISFNYNNKMNKLYEILFSKMSCNF